MEDIIKLRCSNTALETELRLVKEQLTQAHGATNYLVTTFSKQQSNQSDDQFARLQARIDLVEAENAHLRAALGISGYPLLGSSFAKQAITSGQADRARASLDQLQLNAPPTPPRTNDGHLQFAQGNGEVDDLLSFNDGDALSPSQAWSSPSPNTTTPANASSNSSNSLLGDSLFPSTTIRAGAHTVGLGIPNIVDKPQSVVISRDQHATSELREGEDGYKVGNSFVMFTPASSSFQTQASAEPEYQGWRVPYHVRTRLIDRACFIEEYDDEEWERLAEDRGRYSAEEWRRYYEEEIRPEYLARMTRRAAAGIETAELQMQERRESRGHQEIELSETNSESEVEAETIEEDSTSEKTREVDDEAANADDETSEADEEKTEVDEPESPQDICEPRVESEGDMETAAEAPTSEHGLATSRLAPKAFGTPNGIPGILNAPISGAEPDATILPAVEEYLGQEPSTSERPAPETYVPAQVRERMPLTQSIATGFPGDAKAGTTEQTTLANNSKHLQPTSTPVQPAARRPNFGALPVRALHGAHPRLDDEVKNFLFSQVDPTDTRTVLISNIPPNIILAEVLDKVRGGKILSAVFLSSAGMKTTPPIETNAVMVTFLHSERAKEYVEVCSKHWIFFWSTEWDAPCKATVSLIQTPSQCLHASFHENIRREGLSRILYLADNGTYEPDDVVHRILRFDTDFDRGGLGVCKYPVRSGRDKDGIMFLEYTKIEDAVNAKGALKVIHWDFGGMSKGYLPDPCEKAAEGLREVTEAKKVDDQAVMDGAVEATAAVEPTTLRQTAQEMEKSEGRQSANTLEISGTESREEALDAGSPSREPDYTVDKTETTKKCSKDSDLEFARMFMRSFKKNYAKSARSNPREPTYCGSTVGLFADTSKEDEAMGLEG